MTLTNNPITELTRKSTLTVKRLEDAEVNQQHKMQKKFNFGGHFVLHDYLMLCYMEFHATLYCAFWK